MADSKNPIPFNPEGLTIRQAKEGLETLREIFRAVERVENGEVDGDNLIFHIAQWRDNMADRWARGR